MIPNSTIIITIAVGILLYGYLGFYYDSKPSPSSLPSKPSPDKAPSRICEAHSANIAVATSSGARNLTQLSHEVLGLDLSAYPFDRLDALVNADWQRIRDLERTVLDSYMREVGYIYQSVPVSGEDDDASGMKNRRERALRLSLIVFTDIAARTEYLRTLWPAAEKAARGCKAKQGLYCPQEKKVAYIDGWCSSYGFEMDDVGPER